MAKNIYPFAPLSYKDFTNLIAKKIKINKQINNFTAGAWEWRKKKGKGMDLQYCFNGQENFDFAIA